MFDLERMTFGLLLVRAAVDRGRCPVELMMAVAGLGFACRSGLVSFAISIELERRNVPEDDGVTDRQADVTRPTPLPLLLPEFFLSVLSAVELEPVRASACRLLGDCPLGGELPPRFLFDDNRSPLLLKVLARARLGDADEGLVSSRFATDGFAGPFDRFH